MYSYIGTYITHIHRNHKGRIVYVSAEQLQDECFAIKQDMILLPFLRELHLDCCVFPSHGDSRDIEANIENACQSRVTSSSDK